MIAPARLAFFFPPDLKKFKLELFNRIGKNIERHGGMIIRHDFDAIGNLPDTIIPVIGCSPPFWPMIQEWNKRGRVWAYWDRGMFRRVFAASLPWAASREESYYRVHLNCYQMQAIRDVPNDRWKALKYDDVVRPWQKNGRHIVVAAPSDTYCKFHRCESWLAETLDKLSRITDRQIVVRAKEHVRTRPLQKDLDGAHALVTHGSVAAVESVVLGCPVFVHPDSAAALVGLTDLDKIEKPIYPERERWMHSLAYEQWNEAELEDGTVWRMLS